MQVAYITALSIIYLESQNMLNNVALISLQTFFSKDKI